MAYKRIAIYDLDGTVIDSSRRFKAIVCEKTGTKKLDIAAWRASEADAYNDTLLPLHASHYLPDIADNECYVIVATARTMNDAGWRFMHDKLGMPNVFIHRQGDEDTRAGAQIKIDALRGILHLKQFRALKDATVFYEDNADYLKKVCDAFGIRGVYIPSVQGF